MAALDWTPGTQLQIQALDDVLLVGPSSPDGPVCVTLDGYFRVPFRQRRRVGLLIGHRVLLTGRRSRGQLLVHPPSALAKLLAARLTLLDR